jgi:hypothetical protein
VINVPLVLRRYKLTRLDCVLLCVKSRVGSLPKVARGAWLVAPCSDPGGSRVRSGKIGGLRRSHVIGHTLGVVVCTSVRSHWLFFLSPPTLHAAAPLHRRRFTLNLLLCNAADARIPGRSENDSKTIRHAPPLHAGGFLPARVEAELSRPRETEMDSTCAWPTPDSFVTDRTTVSSTSSCDVRKR